MDYLELQTRANIIVDKVNAYEAQLAKQTVDESEILAQHKYADLFSLRPVLKLLLGETLTKKLNRDLINNTNFPVYASTAPMWNTKFGFFNDAIPTSSTEITDLKSYQYHYGYIKGSPVVTVDQATSTITMPANLHLTAPAPIKTSYNAVTSFLSMTNYSAVCKANIDELNAQYLIYCRDIVNNSVQFYRCYNIFFQDTIPDSTYTDELVFWFNTFNNCWYRCKNGAIDLDFGNAFVTIVGKIYYQQSTDENPGFINYIETNQFFITNINNSFEQPILTSNGTLGGDNFAVACSSNYTSNFDAFAATNPSQSRWQMYNGQSFPQWITYYNPTPINVGQITFNFVSIDSLQFFPYEYSLYGSNDNQTWALIEKSTITKKGISRNDINNGMASGFEYSIDVKIHKESYKYHKFQVNSTYQSGICQISYMRLDETKTSNQQLIPSITTHGNIFISSDFKVSNFSNNNYLSMSALDNVAKEFYLKIKLPSSNPGSNMHIFQCDAQCYIMFNVSTYNFNFLNFTDGSWIDIPSTTTFGSTVYIKVEINGTSVKATINNASQTWTDTGIKISPDNRPTLFGKGADEYPFTNGYIYLEDSYYIDSDGTKQFYITTNSEDIDFTQDRHEFMNSLDVYNNNNIIMLDQKQALLTNRDTRIKQGINYAYGSNIKDALVTESQIANIFAWNTTDNRNIKNNIQTTHRQVPGIVMYYLGNGYDNSFTATIGCNASDDLNSIQYSHPVSYGSWYVDIDDWKEERSTSQLPWLQEENGSCCRIFIPGCSYTRGKLESPQQIWQPDRNYYKGIKYQGKAVYHELVFKNRRSGCTDYNLDFDSGLTSIPDNDPQGLATRLALAKNKEFYYNRPWFNELDKENKFDSSALADELVKPEEETTVSYVLDTTNCIFDDEYSNGGYVYDSSTGNITADPEKDYFNFLIQNRTTQSFTIQTGIVAFSLWSSTNINAGYGVCYNGTNYYSTNLTITNSKITVQYNSNTILTVDKSTIDNIVLVMEFTPNSTRVTPYGLKNGSIVSTGTAYTDKTSRTEQYLIDFRPYQVNKNLVYNFADLDIDFPTSIEGLTIKNGQMILQGSTEIDQVIYNIAEKKEETKTKQLTDSEFYNTYRLDYDTYAKIFNQPR